MICISRVKQILETEMDDWQEIVKEAGKLKEKLKILNSGKSYSVDEFKILMKEKKKNETIRHD